MTSAKIMITKVQFGSTLEFALLMSTLNPQDLSITYSKEQQNAEF